jgi:hypothetical protein
MQYSTARKALTIAQRNKPRPEGATLERLPVSFASSSQKTSAPVGSTWRVWFISCRISDSFK